MADGDELADWRWRFTNLYWIKPAEKEPAILFKPRPAQLEILEDIYDRGITREAILKARQLGFSTLLSLVCLDWLLFRAGTRIGIVDLTAEDAEKKRQKIKFAWDSLPPDLREQYHIMYDATGKFAIRFKHAQDRTRELYAGKNARGDTHDLLWVSEWGPIQIEDIHRSDKIADGALPSVQKGVCVIETTWRGGKSGRLWTDVVKQALETTDEHRTLKDWHIRFFPWQLDHDLVWEGSTVQVTNECNKYLDEVEPLAVEEAQRLNFDFNGFSDPQRLWYFKVVWPKPRRSGYEEYPTVMAEMFQSPEPGAVYPEEMASMRSESRITSMPILRAHKAIVSFDLGRDDAMPACFIQWVGHEVRVVDYHTANRETVDYYCAYVRDWCYQHQITNVLIVLPHDSRSHRIEARYSVEEQFDRFGKHLSGIQWDVISIDACANIWDGIDDVRSVFPYMSIATRCDQEIVRSHQTFPGLVECLDHYHAVEIRDGRSISRDVVHDRYSHGADSLRTFCEGYQKGLIHATRKSRSRPQVLTGPGVQSEHHHRRKNVRVRGRLR